MRTWIRALALGGGAALALACAGGKDEPGETGPSGETGDDSADPTDDSSGGDTSFGEVFEPEAPTFTVDFNGGTWTSATGYYLGNNTSFLNATGGDSARSQTITIEIAGNLRYAGTYDVLSVSYAEGPAQGTVDVNYSVRDPAGFTFTVLGFAEETYLFGETSGSASLTDTVGGGGTAAFTNLEVRGWPKF